MEENSYEQVFAPVLHHLHHHLDEEDVEYEEEVGLIIDEAAMIDMGIDEDLARDLKIMPAD